MTFRTEQLPDGLSPGCMKLLNLVSRSLHQPGLWRPTGCKPIPFEGMGLLTFYIPDDLPQCLLPTNRSDIRILVYHDEDVNSPMHAMKYL